MPHGESSGSDQVGVRVLLFSVLRELAGAGEVAVTLPSPATADGLLERLIERYPAFADYGPVVRVAVNRHYVPSNARLHEGDEIALLTPMSGG